MTRMDPRLQAFNELVAMKYQLYNGLFLGLPFEDLADTGVQLPLFANACREKLQAGKSPAEIVDQFFKEVSELVRSDTGMNRICQLNVQYFPQSRLA